MSNRDYPEGSRSINQEQEDKKLWDKLKIYFRLQSAVFLDNRIIGSINIKPDEAFELIEHFVLFANDSSRFKLDRNTRKISVTGFDSTKKDLSVYIEAISMHSYLSPKSSMKQHFRIIPQRFPLTPIVDYEWSWKDSKPSLIVQWFHMSDNIAQTYVLCLDNKEIQYIRKPLKHDAYQVCINNFKPRARHTFQILARLNNGKETYRSEPIDITVPDGAIQGTTEVINVSEEPGELDNMQDLIDKDEKNAQGRLSQTKQQPAYKKPNTSLACGCPGPHEKFLGVHHYFEITRKEPPSYIQSEPLTLNRRITPFNKEDTDDNAENQQKKKNEKSFELIIRLNKKKISKSNIRDYENKKED